MAANCADHSQPARLIGRLVMSPDNKPLGVAQSAEFASGGAIVLNVELLAVLGAA